MPIRSNNLTSFPVRKSPRLRGFDYSSPGAYFVTICTHQRRRILAAITGGTCRHTELGELIAEEWKALPAHWSVVELDAFCIMPTHVHGVLHIRGRAGHRAGLAAIIGGFKSGVTRKARSQGLHSEGPLWQTRYYDHVVRDGADLFMVRQYIELNSFYAGAVASTGGALATQEELERELRDQYGLTGYALYAVLTSEKAVRLLK